MYPSFTLLTFALFFVILLQFQAEIPQSFSKTFKEQELSHQNESYEKSFKRRFLQESLEKPEPYEEPSEKLGMGLGYILICIFLTQALVLFALYLDLQDSQSMEITLTEESSIEASPDLNNPSNRKENILHLENKPIYHKNRFKQLENDSVPQCGQKILNLKQEQQLKSQRQDIQVTTATARPLQQSVTSCLISPKSIEVDPKPPEVLHLDSSPHDQLPLAQKKSIDLTQLNQPLNSSTPSISEPLKVTAPTLNSLPSPNNIASFKIKSLILNKNSGSPSLMPALKNLTFAPISLQQSPQFQSANHRQEFSTGIPENIIFVEKLQQEDKQEFEQKKENSSSEKLQVSVVVPENKNLPKEKKLLEEGQVKNAKEESQLTNSSQVSVAKQSQVMLQSSSVFNQDEKSSLSNKSTQIINNNKDKDKTKEIQSLPDPFYHPIQTPKLISCSPPPFSKQSNLLNQSNDNSLILDAMILHTGYAFSFPILNTPRWMRVFMACIQLSIFEAVISLLLRNFNSSLYIFFISQTITWGLVYLHAIFFKKVFGFLSPHSKERSQVLKYIILLLSQIASLFITICNYAYTPNAHTDLFLWQFGYFLIDLLILDAVLLSLSSKLFILSPYIKLFTLKASFNC